MSTSIRKYAIGAGVACALAMSFASPSQAFPAMTNTATINSSMPSMVTDVRYYGRGYRGGYYGRGHGYGGGAAAGIIGGLAAGAIIGSAVANSGYYYGPGPYAYGGGPYAYEPAPVYVQPRYYRGDYYDGGAAPCWPCY